MRDLPDGLGLPACHTCGNRRGPLRPTGDRYPNGAQQFACIPCADGAAYDAQALNEVIDTLRETGNPA